jgi:hypothetical protein
MGNGALPNGPSYRAHPRLYATIYGLCDKNPAAIREFLGLK